MNPLTRVRTRLGALTVLILWGVWFPAQALGETADAVQEAVEDIERNVMRTLRSKRIAGSVLVLFAEGKLVHARGYGVADADGGRLIRPDTPIAVGEYTKLVTAMAVMRLVDDGKIALDAPITRYLKDIPFAGRRADARPPSVRELLAHLGGLVNSRFGGSLVNDSASAGAPLPTFDRANPPSTIYVYSHQGYVLLGQLIANITGKSFAQSVAELVFEPLGMTQSGFLPPDDLALPHNRAGRTRAHYYLRDTAALGLYSTGNDLARLMAWWLGEDPSPWSASARAEMVREQNTHVALDLDNRTGFAWQLTNTGSHAAKRVWRLESVLPYHRGALTLLPDEGIGVLFLSNSSAAGDASLDLNQAAVDTLVQHLTGRVPAEPPQELELPRGAQPASMASHYNTGFGLLELIPEEDGVFGMRFLGKPFGLERQTNGWYQVSYRLFGLIDIRISVLREVLFHPVSVGKAQGLLARYGNGSFLFGTSFGKPGNEEVSRLAGNYRLLGEDRFASEMGIEELALRFEDGLLRAQYKLPYDITLYPEAPLIPVAPDRFEIPGLGTNMGGEVHVDTHPDGRVIIEYSGWRFVREAS